MSGIGETRQRSAPGRVASWRAAWRAAAWPMRLLRVLLGIVCVAGVALALALFGLAWRLAQGPLDVTWLLRRAESMMVTPGTPVRVAIGEASLAWNGFTGGAESGLMLRLHDLRAIDRAGTPGASVAQADVTMSPSTLMQASVTPDEVTLEGVRLRAERSADGSVHFDLAGGKADEAGDADRGASLAGILAELRQPAHSGSGGSGLGPLRHVVVRHAQLVLEDQASGRTLQGDIASLDLRRNDAGGITGAAEAELSVGVARAALKLDADLLRDGGTRLDVTLAPLRLDALAQVDPALSPVGLLDAAVAGQAQLVLSPALLPQHATVQLSAGPGRFGFPSTPVAFERLALGASARWDGESSRPSDVSVQQAEAVLLVPDTGRTTTLRVHGAGTRRDGTLTAQGGVTLDHAAFADLPLLWPVEWGGHVRPWITENITSGVARDGDFTATVSAPESNPAAITIVQAGGTMQADDLTIHWLRPVPPIEHAQAAMTVVSPDELDISVPRAAQNGIAITDGLIRFTALQQKDQDMALAATLEGPVPDLLDVLREKRLHLLDAHPFPAKNPAGAIKAKLTVTMPLVAHLEFDQVGITAAGKIADLHLGKIIAGRDLDHGDIDFAVTQDGLHADGSLTVAGVAGRAEVAMDFQAGPPTQVQEQAHFTGRVGAAGLKSAGLDTGGVIGAGEASIDVTYLERRNGASRIGATADLTGAGLSVAGWRKQPGAKAQAAATVLLEHGKLVGVPSLEAHGPALDVVGRAETIDGLPRLLHLPRIVIGPTHAQGDIRFPARPGEPLRVRLSGPLLDLSGLLDGGMGDGGDAPFVADVRFGRVVLEKGRALLDVVGHAERRQGRLTALRLTSGGPERLEAVIAPDGNGRRVTVRAGNTGALLRGLGVFDTLDGGALSLDAHYDDRFADPPLSGKLDVGNFAIRDAVVLGKLLQAVTIYGVGDALRGRGVYFAKLQAPFCLCQNVLRLGASQAYSASLGLTAQGWVDFNRKLADVSGTVVPAYAVNSALGRLPLIGKAFTAEPGGGLIAVGYRVSGALDNPGVAVNPLTALTPGFLRRLFGWLS